MNFLVRYIVSHLEDQVVVTMAFISDLRRIINNQRNRWIFFLVLIGIAAPFRIAVAHWLPNDAPDDGRTYAQIARNVLDQHVYSHETEAPYAPSLIRLPGYPLFLAAIYAVFRVYGHGDNGAVRIVQALIDTGTCALVALLAFYWQPDEKRKRATAIAALALAAVCPFTTIYAATILTEVPTTFLVMAMLLAATFAFRAEIWKRALLCWLLAGLCGGLAVLFRPDSGLFAFAVGLTLVVTGLIRIKREWRNTLVAGAVFSLAFMLVLAPWTIRNARVFHLFQPLAPSHGEMPGEFVPRGYNAWLRTWLDDEAYIGPFLWSLDDKPIDIDDVPPSAFDSADEKTRVAALLDKYNQAPDSETDSSKPAQSQTSATPAPQTSPTPDPANSKPSVGKSKSLPKGTPQKNAKTNANANSNTNGDDDDSDEGDQNDNSGDDKNDNSSDQGDQGDNKDEADQSEDHGAVEMTPEIDAGFAQLARERIARHPFRYYVWLPLKRARTMWLDTHSQYWPFEGTLLPFEDLDHGTHQQIWLPLFASLTGIFTLLGLAGGWLLWNSRVFEARRWLLLASLAIVLRLILFSSLENPEPRYLVEFFPFLAVLGGIAIARVPNLRRTTNEH